MRAPELLAERYKFARSIQVGASTLAWLATDQRFGRQVVACALGDVRLKALERAVGVEQTYLATLLDLIRDPAPEAIPGEEPMKVPAVAIAEYVPGLTLHDQLKAGALPAAEAVTMIARAAEALQALHAAGAMHGAISPRSLVVAPSVARPAPVVAQLIAPASGAYSTPERLEGGGPTTDNDVWALYATLYAALTAGVAFDGASKEELALAMREQRRKSLADCGVDRPELEALLADGLAGSADRRRSSIGDLINGLSTWLKNRDASVAETAELARLSMDWEGDEPPDEQPTAKPPTTTVEYAIFDDEAAEDQTTVFVRPSAILATMAKSAPSAESEATSGVFDPPPGPTLSPAPDSELLAPPPPQPPPPSDLLPEPPLQAELEAPPVDVPLQPPSDASTSKPPPLPDRPRPAITDKPRHPNKRRAAEEAQLEKLRSEAPPIDNESSAVIPMFPLDALYAKESPAADAEAKAEAPAEAAIETAGDAKPEPKPEAWPEEPANTIPPKRDTGMASRAPPKPKVPGSDEPPPSSVPIPLIPPKIEVSKKTRPRRDSKPWQDLTQPSKARRAESVAQSSASVPSRSLTAMEPQGSPWAWIAGILGALAVIGISALELERRSVQAPIAPPTNAPVVQAEASTAPANTESDAATSALDAGLPGQGIATEGGAGAGAANPLATCVASYFPPGTFTGSENFGYLCEAADFRGIVSQLHRSVVVSAGGKVTEGMRQWATLGWYELGATALVRIRCCPDAAPIDLPKYSGKCEALPVALASVVREPLAPADVEARSQALSTAVRCLYWHGIPRPYHYGIQPSGQNRLVFKGFLERAAARDH